MKRIEGKEDGDNVPAMPGKPFRSKLIPHWNLIQTMRAGRATWKEISDHLSEKCGCPTSHQAVQAFFARQQKGRAPLGFKPHASESTETNAPAAMQTGISLPKGEDNGEQRRRNLAAAKEMKRKAQANEGKAPAESEWDKLNTDPSKPLLGS